MISCQALSAVLLFITLVPEGSLSHTTLNFPKKSDQNCIKPTYLAKVHFKQSEGYVQSIHYGASVPDLTNGFTTHFWINLEEINGNSTVLSYAVGLDQLDTIILKYVSGDVKLAFWELTLNGSIVFTQGVPPLPQGDWSHITATWNAYSNTWALYQDGRLIAEGTSLQVVDKVVSGGGEIAIGADQTTLHNGSANETLSKGLEGWITHLYFHSKHIHHKDYFQKIWPSRCSVDMPVFNDIIDWVKTPRKLVGGVTEVKANAICGFF